jgi:hypothetical protein
VYLCCLVVELCLYCYCVGVVVVAALALDVELQVHFFVPAVAPQEGYPLYKENPKVVRIGFRLVHGRSSLFAVGVVTN